MARFPGVGSNYPLQRHRSPFDPSAKKIAENRTVPLSETLNAKIPGALDGELVSITFNATTSVAVTVKHSLKRVPVGFIVVSLKKGAAGISAFSTVPAIYMSAAPTRTTITFSCTSGGQSTTVANRPVAKILVY